MKNSLIAIVLILTSLFIAHAQESSKYVKQMLSIQKMKDQRLLDLNKQYVAALEKLKIKTTKAGDLESALIVKKEIEDTQKTIEQMSNLQEKVKAKPTKLSKRSFKNKIDGTKWKWWGTETLILKSNNKGVWSASNKEDFTWKVVDEVNRVIEGKTPQGKVYKITFKRDFKKGKIVEDGNERDTERLEP